MINKELVSEINRLGGKAIGICGATRPRCCGQNNNRELGFTAEEVTVDVRPLRVLLNAGYMPVVAPVCMNASPQGNEETNLLNVNGDTIAARIAASLHACKLIFLTDVPGISDESRQVMSQIKSGAARTMIENGTATGGMIAKLEASLIASKSIADPHHRRPC